MLYRSESQGHIIEGSLAAYLCSGVCLLEGGFGLLYGGKGQMGLPRKTAEDQLLGKQEFISPLAVEMSLRRQA